MFEDRLSARNGAFSRTTQNEIKMGAYYTDVAHCRSLQTLFSFPEGEKVVVLEPSIGDGSAVTACTGADKNEKIRIIGVELNDNVARETAKLPQIEKLLNADFTCGIKASHNISTFCFGNPPYMADEDEKGGRMEHTFLVKVTDYLKKGAVLVWVIPYREMANPQTVRFMMCNYETVGCWRFRDDEYQKWKQVVFVGRKKDRTTFPLAEELQAEIKKYADVSLLPILPETFEGTPLYHSVEVHPSDPADIVGFTAKELNLEDCYSFLSENPMPNKFRQIVNRRVSVPRFTATDIGRPPIKPKKDTLCLVGVAGVGQGIAGEEGVDLHLQRGTAKVVQDKEYETTEDGKTVCKVTSRTQITMSILQTNGEFTKLQ